MENGIEKRFGQLREFYNSRSTRDIVFRLKSLHALRDSIKRYEAEIAEALREDLGKSPRESYLTETGIVLAEIDVQIRNLRLWMRPRRVSSPMALFPSRSRIIYEPKGVVLILAPWNYPFQLAINPLVGAIAAGNCVALKPSTTSSATCRLIARLVAETFSENHVTVFDGEHAQTAELLTYRFDHIFFTGGVNFGRTVMSEAAKNLIPVTLELGGKSPCIVDAGADPDIAARRIVWGKFVNAGQTCIAPDYLFVHSSLKDILLEKMIATLREFYGENIKESELYPRIISDKAFDRLAGYLSGPGRIIHGGDTNRSARYIAPTFMDGVQPDSPLMTEEIFGPILPIMTFDDIHTVMEFVNSREKPLAFYYFGKKRAGKRVLAHTTSGGACINDTLMYIVNPALPFGGAGTSGMGRYHGRWSFETFSNARATVFSPRRADIPMRYPPYRRFGLLKKLL